MVEHNQKTNYRDLRQKFNDAWPTLLEEIVQDKSFLRIPEATKWLTTVMNRNVPMGKQNRAMAAITFYRQLVKGETAEDERLTFILGWLAEIGQAAALMADDIMDGSETRRGEKCWYKEKGIGLSAVNDVLFLENISYFILYKYFSGKEYFHRLLALGHDMTLKTIMGQSIDTRFAIQFNFDECTIEKYKRIVEYKTSYYTFYHPYASALVTAGITDELVFDQLEEISLEMGFLFQAQDDYLDLYGDPVLTGKVGTDIIDKKCTWLLVTALERANEEQRSTLEICYGSQLRKDEDEVKQIYKELKIKQRFLSFETESYRDIGSKIKKLPVTIPGGPLMALLNALYRRDK